MGFVFVSILILSVSIDYIITSRQRELVKRIFAKKVSNAVMDDLLKHDNDETSYMITDTNKKIYKFENSMWRLHWQRAEQWNEVSIGEKWHVEGVGIRSPFFGSYPNIYKIKKLS